MIGTKRLLVPGQSMYCLYLPQNKCTSFTPYPLDKVTAHYICLHSIMLGILSQLSFYPIWRTSLTGSFIRCWGILVVVETIKFTLNSRRFSLICCSKIEMRLCSRTPSSVRVNRLIYTCCVILNLYPVQVQYGSCTDETVSCWSGVMNAAWTNWESSNSGKSDIPMKGDPKIEVLEM
jgi:hypothetical protein